MDSVGSVAIQSGWELPEGIGNARSQHLAPEPVACLADQSTKQAGTVKGQPALVEPPIDG